MTTPKTKNEARCLNCRASFVVMRDFSNRNAHIRYCVKCKKAGGKTDYRPNRHKAGLPRKISKFSSSGKVSIMAD